MARKPLTKATPNPQAAHEPANTDQRIIEEKEIRKSGNTAARGRKAAGLVQVGGDFSPEVRQQLKLMAAENNTTSRALLVEALNLLFASYQKPEIAE